MHSTQHTVKGPHVFHGKGLHTGKVSTMTIYPAPVDSGISFVRSDLGGAAVPALAEHVSGTARSTSLSLGEAAVMTVEHVLSALTGLGVDNARIEIDGVEVPILDGSAKPYIDSILAGGLEDQLSPRRVISIPEAVEVRDGQTGSFVRIEPAERAETEVTVDFGSKVLGVQSARWDESVDYATEIGVCRTFVFFHELEYLFSNNLIKGGDVDNAIVIVEHPVTDAQLGRLSSLFGMPKLEVRDNGYLNNLQLRFPNECGRHKLLDLIGDLRLIGGYARVRVTAFKPGHGINTAAAKAVRELLKNT